MKNQTCQVDLIVIDNNSDQTVVNSLKKENVNVFFVNCLNVGTAGAFFIG